MAATTRLTWKHFPAGENGFFRAPALISDEDEAVLTDGGFTLSDGKALAEAIKANDKITTFHIIQSDPGYRREGREGREGRGEVGLSRPRTAITSLPF